MLAGKNEKRVEIKVLGLVQGVNFRYYTKEEASHLGLSGFVKNEGDGSVTIIAEGEEKALRKLIDWVKQGPSLAKIDKIKIKWGRPQGEQGFGVDY